MSEFKITLARIEAVKEAFLRGPLSASDIHRVGDARCGLPCWFARRS